MLSTKTKTTEILHKLLEQDWVDALFPCWGSRAMGSDAYNKAKAPACSTWKTGEGYSVEEMSEKLEQGFWLGIRIKHGYAVLDIDDPERAKRVHELLTRMFPEGFFHMHTKKGIHLPMVWRRGINDAIEQISFAFGDIRIGGKGYIVGFTTVQEAGELITIADTGLSERILEWGRLLEMPVFYSQEFCNLGKDRFQEGNRDNLLFQQGRSVWKKLVNRGYPEDRREGRLRYELLLLNALLDPPLSENEVMKKIEHIINYEDREGDAKNNGHGSMPEEYRPFRFQTEADYEEDLMEEMDNPFTRLLSLKDALQEEGGQIEPFWSGICHFGDVVLVVGSPKSGKSTFVRSWALNVANDHPVLGEMASGQVWWYALEERIAQIDLSFSKSANLLGTDNILFCSVNTNKIRNPIQKFTHGLRHALLQAENPPVMIVVDTVGRLMVGVDINDYETVQQLIEEIRWAIRGLPKPPVVVLVHHTNKSQEKTPLGSQAFVGSVDVVMTLNNEEDYNTIKIQGRGIDVRYNNKSLPLRYDAEHDLITGIGSPVCPAVQDMMQHLHKHGEEKLQTIRNWAGGSIRTDVNRLIRQGYLIVEGEKVRLNMERRGIERYLEIPTMSLPNAKSIGENIFEKNSENPEKSETFLEPDASILVEHTDVETTLEEQTDAEEEDSAMQEVKPKKLWGLWGIGEKVSDKGGVMLMANSSLTELSTLLYGATDFSEVSSLREAEEVLNMEIEPDFPEDYLRLMETYLDNTLATNGYAYLSDVAEVKDDLVVVHDDYDDDDWYNRLKHKVDSVEDYVAEIIGDTQTSEDADLVQTLNLLYTAHAMKHGQKSANRFWVMGSVKGLPCRVAFFTLFDSNSLRWAVLPVKDDVTSDEIEETITDLKDSISGQRYNRQFVNSLLPDSLKKGYPEYGLIFVRAEDTEHPVYVGLPVLYRIRNRQDFERFVDEVLSE